MLPRSAAATEHVLCGLRKAQEGRRGTRQDRAEFPLRRDSKAIPCDTLNFVYIRSTKYAVCVLLLLLLSFFKESATVVQAGGAATGEHRRRCSVLDILTASQNCGWVHVKLPPLGIDGAVNEFGCHQQQQA